METTSVDIDDDSYIDRLHVVRAEEESLIERLIFDRRYLADMFRIDALTGLHNRKILPKVREFGTVVMCDVDDFKGINDSLGHVVGDRALRSIGHSISENIRVGDVGCRFGGDEFLIIFTTSNKEVIDKWLKKIVFDANREAQLPGQLITLSMGVAFREESETLEELMNKADQALYESKGNGKDQVTYYERGKVYEHKRPVGRRLEVKS